MLVCSNSSSVFFVFPNSICWQRNAFYFVTTLFSMGYFSHFYHSRKKKWSSGTWLFLSLLCNKPQKRFLTPYCEVLQSTALSSTWLETPGKKCGGLSFCSGCFDFQYLANWDGFILSVASISRYSIHWGHGSSLIIVNVNPYFRLPSW